MIGALCHHCQLDADREGLLDKEDDFAEFRERCSELVKDVIFVVGSRDCFDKLRSRLNDAEVQVSADEGSAGDFEKTLPPWSVADIELVESSSSSTTFHFSILERVECH